MPVVDLQTNFGGGKTHSMIALYHLFSGLPVVDFPQEIQELLSATGVKALPAVRRAVVVGTEMSPGQPETKPDADGGAHALGRDRGRGRSEASRATNWWPRPTGTATSPRPGHVRGILDASDRALC